VVTNRPSGFIDKLDEDVYVVNGIMAFMSYLKSFDDVYVGYQLNKGKDIAKQYHSVPLLAPSMPKNTLLIKTCNSKDWTTGKTST
jgi:hypothetical protein